MTSSSNKRGIHKYLIHHPRDGRTRYKRCFFMLLLCTCVLALLFWLIPHNLLPTKAFLKQLYSEKFRNISQDVGYSYENIEKVLPKMERKRKLILQWTNYFNIPDWLPQATKLQCPVTECDIISDRSLIANSSAVILHWPDININSLPQCFSSENVQCPLWVLFNLEAPHHTSYLSLTAIQNRVHWIVTYRKDSDIFAPYGKVVPKQIHGSLEMDFNPGRRLLCWLVSNCRTPSKREIFVEQLKKYVDVDIYGRCGYMKCPHKSTIECYLWLSKRCMFYFSLENAICKDYTTEKLYHALATGMVPIVMGNSYNFDHLPPNSYINAADFCSPKELGEYLVTVAENKTLYLSYLEWKKYYEIKDQIERPDWICDLCEKLHSTEVKNIKPHSNLTSWWFDHAECKIWKNFLGNESSFVTYESDTLLERLTLK